MRSELRWLSVLLIVGCGLAACGDGPGVPIQVVIGRADALMFPPDKVDVLVYGSRATCSSLEFGAETNNDDRCGPSADEEAGNCYLASVMLAYQLGATTERLVVSTGQRNVLILGRDSFNDVTVTGCSAVTIEEGKAASVTVLLKDI